MRIHQVLNVLVLAAGMHSIGCAVDDVGDSKTSTATSALSGGVPTGVQCTNKEWQVDFLDDATHTIVVGSMSCPSCFGPEMLAGVESNFDVLDYEFKCDNN